jgi:hypothetical protein
MMQQLGLLGLRRKAAAGGMEHTRLPETQASTGTEMHVQDRSGLEWSWLVLVGAGFPLNYWPNGRGRTRHVLVFRLLARLKGFISSAHARLSLHFLTWRCAVPFNYRLDAQTRTTSTVLHFKSFEPPGPRCSSLCLAFTQPRTEYIKSGCMPTPLL